jgi:hypothetical protein
VILAGNVHPLVAPMMRAGLDRGRVDDAMALDRMLLVLKRPAERELALAKFMQEAHTPGAAGYHKWLTPEEFGARFGAADSDLAAVKAWLEWQGLTVGKVHPGRIAIEFSGNAGKVSAAFQTEIHRFQGAGAADSESFANVRDPQIPAALADVIKAISPMHSFHARPLVTVAGKTSFNAKTHKARPAWTYPVASTQAVFELTPGDFAVQYDLGPVYAAGTKGAGQSIGILSASNIDLELVQSYQALFGLAANLPTVVVDGNDPGLTDAATEAYLDVELAGSVAPAANVILYTSAGTILTDPLLTAGLRALEDNQVSVLSVSYGSCEAALGAGGNAAWAALWQEAAAQGITGFVAAGDSGTDGCDDAGSQQFAMGGLAVNGIGSTPYNVSVGATDFYYSNYATGGSALTTQVNSYWSGAASATATTSLLQVAPEQAWNNPFGMNASSGGVYDVYDSTILATGGGASGAALYSSAGVASGYAKPAWQAGTGVPADTARHVPDVALFGANGENFVYYPICALPGDCVNTAAGGAVSITSVGGTSASAPAMAAIQALVDQATNSRQGQANNVYYALATKTAAATAKPFNDVMYGGNQVPCYQGTAVCVLGTAGSAKGYYYDPYYTTTKGYDRATGLGSVDVANLIKGWSSMTFRSTTTTLSISPATFAHGAAVAIKATVAPATGSGVPTGSVGLVSNDAVAYANGLGVFSLATGAVSASVDNLPGGTYQVIADYSGDSAYGASASAPVTITVTPESDTLNTTGWVLNPTDNNLYPLQAGMYLPYGSEIFLEAQPVGMNEANSPLGQTAPATGAVAFTDKVGTTVLKTTQVPLNSVGIAEWTPGTLTVGTHVVSASFAGDASLAASTQAAAASVTIFRGNTSLSVTPLVTSVKAGSTVTVDLEMFSGYLPLVGTLPTGNVSVTLGNQTIVTAMKSWMYGAAGSVAGKPVQEAVVVFTNVPAGVLPLSAAYAGDTNWQGSSALYGSVNSLATKPAPAVTLTAATTSYAPNGIVTMTGTVTGTAALGAPTGTLAFTWEDGGAGYANLVQATSATTSAFTLTFPANQLANGSNLFVATYKGDANYSAQASAPLTIVQTGSDFSLTTTTQTVSVKIGASGTGMVVISPVGTFPGTVTVSCTAPAGITCTPISAAPTVSAGVADGLTFKVAGTVAAGTYAAVVTVTGGGHVHTAQILVAAHN